MNSPNTESIQVFCPSTRMFDRCDESHQFSATAAAAGFFFSFRSVLVLVSARGLGLGTEPGVIGNFLLGLSLLLVVSFQAAGPAVTSIGSIWRNSTVQWVAFFLALSLCSLSWSATVSPLASALYWLALALDVAIVVLLYQTHGRTVILHSIIKGFIWSTVLLTLVAWVMPLEADLRLGDQEYFNTNQIGNLCAIAMFLWQLLRAEKVRVSWIPGMLLVLTLLRSLSKATLAAFAVGQLYLFFRNKWMSRKRKLIVAASAALVILSFGGLFENYYGVYTTAGNQAETLTGRTAIWAYSLDSALQKPWLGNGIDSMWKVIPPFGNDLFEARHAENELLQQFFAYGVAGSFLVFGIYASLYRRVRLLPSGISRATLISLLIFIFVRGLAEAEPFDLLLPLWLIATLSIGLSRFSASRRSDVAIDSAGPVSLSQQQPQAICRSVQG